MFKAKRGSCKWVFVFAVAFSFIFVASFALAESNKLWLHDPGAILSEYREDFNLEKDTQGGYQFLGKNYKALEEIGEDDIARIPAIQLVEKTKDRAKFKSFATYALIAPTQAKGEQFHIVRLPGGGSGGEVGKPELPYYGQFITVPQGVEVELVVENVKLEALPGEYQVFPVQPPLPDTKDAKEPEFTKDEKTYKQDKYIGAEQPVRIASDVIIRGKRLIYVIYQPVLHNPARKKLESAWKVDWSLKYKYPKAATSFKKEKLWEREYANSVGRMVIDALPESTSTTYTDGQSLVPGQGYKVDAGTNGADYLIIVHDNFYNQILPLAEWKEKKGYKVHVTKLTEINATGTPSASEIKSYITSAYTNWTPQPLYVLLVGDAQFLAPSVATTSVATDLYYAAVDGTDIFPDFFLGRLPCATTGECTTMVNKILLMEKTPPAVASFYNNALIAGYFQDDNRDGIEDRLFIETAEAVKDFLTFKGWSVSTSYVSGSSVTPRKYNVSSLIHTSNTLYVNTQTYLSASASVTAVTNGVNNGVCLVQHRDHGAETMWGDPPYTNNHVMNLTNNNMLPLVNSLNCLTGRFDYSGGDCFAEAWLKKVNGGAYGIIAATRVSYSWWNDYLTHGIYECIWPGYFQTLSTFSGYKTGLSYSGNYVGYGAHLGQILNFGKIFMFDKYAGGSQTGTCLVEFQIFHLLGCPEQEARLVLPQALTVNYPEKLISGPADFDITVTSGTQPVAGARVSLLLKPTEFYVGITDAQGKVNFGFTPASTGDMQITVTHKDFLPFEGKFSIIAAPTGVSFVPSSGTFNTNTFYNFTAVYSDANGYNDIKTADLIINTSPVTGAFYVQYRQDENKLYIYYGATAYGGYVPGTNVNIATTYGTLNCYQTTVSRSGNNLTINWKISFNNALAGTRNAYLAASGMTGASSGWQQKGTIYINAAPTMVSLSPNSGTFLTNTTYTFSTVHSDANGLVDLVSANFMVNTNNSTSGAFLAHYRRDQRLLFLYNGTTQVGGYAPGSPNVIETPYGKLYCNQTTVSGSGNNLTVNWKVSFKPTVSGQKNVYLSSSDTKGASSGVVQKGTIVIANPFYRFYDKTNGTRFYTASEEEKNRLLTLYANTFTYEGIACGVFIGQGSGTVALYRFCNKTNGEHFYTSDEAEKTNLIANYSYVWLYEGVACYVYPRTAPVTGSVPLYRFWDKLKGVHLYTVSEAEKNNLINNYASTYTYEGIACYVYPSS